MWYCIRGESGECEVLLGNDAICCPAGCTEACFTAAEQEVQDKFEMIMDSFVGQLMIKGTDCVNYSEIPFCDDGTAMPTGMRLIVASCKTAGLPDQNGRETRYTCDGSGYCKYEYTYCKHIEIENGEEVIYTTYDRKALTKHSDECVGTYKVGQIDHPCYPINEDGEDCYDDKIGIKVIELYDIIQYETCQSYYETNQIRLAPIGPLNW